MLKNKKIWIPLLVIVTGSIFYFSGGSSEEENDIEVTVEKGDFVVAITTAGELKAKSSKDIMGPSSGMRRLGLYDTKIAKLIPEGTRVDSGDFVASLDRSDLMTKLKDLDLEVQKMESQFLQTKLDTTLDLRSARNELVNLKFQLEEVEIKLEQSKYEPPATIRKAEIELEQIQRKYEQEVSNLQIKQAQAEAKMSEVAANLSQQTSKKDLMVGMLDDFTIKAPTSGIIIYVRKWDGSKLTTGSTISPWSPKVAELPNLSRMISQTYVNEVDIRRVKAEQLVDIGVDAYPDKKLKGKVIQVANVGEQMPNSEAKVFQVTIELIAGDTSLLPGMTTSNIIVSESISESLFVPLECIHALDSVFFVYKNSGFSVVKQQVRLGIANDNYAVIIAGLEEGESLLLSIPENHNEIDIELLQ